jgi:hypothetical protein
MSQTGDLVWHMGTRRTVGQRVVTKKGWLADGPAGWQDENYFDAKLTISIRELRCRYQTVSSVQYH